MTDEEIAAAVKEEGFLDAFVDALIYYFKKGSRMKFSNPKTVERICDTFNGIGRLG